MTDFEKQTYLKYACENFINDKKIGNTLILAILSSLSAVGVHCLDTNLLVESSIEALGVAGTIPLALKVAFNLFYAHIRLANTARPENDALYRECLDMYNEYINRLASLLSEVPVKDSLHLSIFLDNCIKSGFFSCSGLANYQKFNNDLDGRYNDLLGTRVLLGESVCRHNTVFSTDVLRAMGYKAFYVSVDSLKKHSRYDFKSISPFSNHAVTGIVDSNGRYIYDFTWHEAAFFDSKVSNTLGVRSNINIYLANSLRNFYNGIESDNKGYVLSRNWFYDDLSMFMSTPDKKVDLANIDEYVCLTEKLIREYYVKLIDFRNDNLKLTEDIVELSKVLMPFSYTKTK